MEQSQLVSTDNASVEIYESEYCVLRSAISRLEDQKDPDSIIIARRLRSMATRLMQLIGASGLYGVIVMLGGLWYV